MSNELNLVSEDTFTEQTDEIVSAINQIGGGGSITVDTAMSGTSTNAVQNKVIKEYVDGNSGVLPFVVNMIFDGTNLTADKTFGELKTAADDNKIVYMKTNIPNVVDSVTTMICISLTGGGYSAAFYNDSNKSIQELTGQENDYPTVRIS